MTAPGTLALTFLSHRSEHPDAAAALADLRALIAERDALARSEARTARADVARLREALAFYAKEPCMMRNGIHCTMVPAGVEHRTCGPCEARAALAATAERGK